MQEETGWLDYGARMYQAEIGRFFNQDRFSEKYFNNTPYHYALNNPIVYIDINGDSTVYYDNNGNRLWVSHDGLENGVTFIDDDNILDFYEQLGKDLENDQSSNLRGFGTTYNISTMTPLMNDNIDDNINKDTGERNPGGQANEYSTYLYKDEHGEIVGGEEHRRGYYDASYWFEGEEGKERVGRLHTHDERSFMFGGFRRDVEKRPSNDDMEKHTDNKDGVYNVIIGTENIYFYGNRNHQSTYQYISIKRKTLFKK